MFGALTFRHEARLEVGWDVAWLLGKAVLTTTPWLPQKSVKKLAPLARSPKVPASDVQRKQKPGQNAWGQGVPIHASDIKEETCGRQSGRLPSTADSTEARERLPIDPAFNFESALLRHAATTYHLKWNAQAEIELNQSKVEVIIACNSTQLDRASITRQLWR